MTGERTGGGTVFTRVHSSEEETPALGNTTGSVLPVDSGDCEGPVAGMVAQRLKRLLVMWETQVQSLCREDPLEKEMATHCSVPAWKNPMDRGA